MGENLQAAVAIGTHDEPQPESSDTEPIRTCSSTMHTYPRTCGFLRCTEARTVTGEGIAGQEGNLKAADAIGAHDKPQLECSEAAAQRQLPVLRTIHLVATLRLASLDLKNRS